MSGSLIVIESGTDSSGKETQTNKLYERLKKEKEVLKIEYPDYKSDSSALVKMYLNGAFGDKAGDVNPYAASTFFAVDRYASFKKKWSSFYQQGGIIIADRYTTSNMVHQGAKISDKREREDYLNWLTDFEFNKLGLPKPDIVVFLDLAPKLSKELLQKRNQAGSKSDIHEADDIYLNKCYNAALNIAKDYEWEIIDCAEQGKIKSIDLIAEDIYSVIKNNL